MADLTAKVKKQTNTHAHNLKKGKTRSNLKDQQLPWVWR